VASGLWLNTRNIILFIPEILSNYLRGKQQSHGYGSDCSGVGFRHHSIACSGVGVSRSRKFSRNRILTRIFPASTSGTILTYCESNQDGPGANLQSLRHFGSPEYRTARRRPQGAQEVPRRGDQRGQVVCWCWMSFCETLEETTMIHHVYGDRVSSTDEERQTDYNVWCLLDARHPYAEPVRKQFARSTASGPEERECANPHSSPLFWSGHFPAQE